MATGTATRQLSILVCDDERSIVRLLQAILEKQGHKVTLAFDGMDALEELQRAKFDLILLDIMMPRVDGMEVLAWIRQQPELSDLPVIVLSAKQDDRDVFDAYHSGADVFLPKPIDPKELLAFIDRILS
jgi:DNA-binding response OmpR family regulator